MKTTLLTALFPVLLLSAERVSAYYDPGAQRWLNRDPLGDGGSLVYAASRMDGNASSGNTLLEQEEGQDSAVHLEEVEGPSLYAYLNNSPTGHWDAFGLDKAGKRNMACEGFTKKSDPQLVKEAMDAAKAANQTKRYRALRGLLKVIKRGAGMMWIWVDISLIELEQMLREQSGCYEV